MELIAVNFPLNWRSGYASARTVTSRSFANFERYCSGNAKSTYTGSSAVSATTCWPALIIWPTFTWRIPSCPSNGAISDFFAMFDRIWSTRAFSRVNFDWAESSSALETTLFMARSRNRSRSVRASCASAAADRKSASSCDVSSFMSTSPFFASPPFSKLISLTMPASSVDMTAPCTAESEPTAESIGAQSSSFTVALDTVVGGITIFVVIILPICSALTPKTQTTIATSRPIAMTRPRRRRGLTVDCVGTFEILFAMSCISEFCLRFEQQTPEPACHFQLSRPPFRRGRLLRAQHIEHQHSARDRELQYRHLAERR